MPQSPNRMPLDKAFAEAASESPVAAILGIRSVTAVCPRCGVVSAFESVGSFVANETKFDGLSSGSVGVWRCRSCLSGAVSVGGIGQQGRLRHLLWPAPIWPSQAPPQLEPPIQKAYDEARAILSASAQGAAVLARRCVQHVIRMRLGITEKTLFQEIAKAVQRPELTKPTRDALDHVRQIGNFGAHPDIDQANQLIEVTSEEAEYTLEVLELLFNDLYVIPAKTVSMGSRLKAKK